MVELHGSQCGFCTPGIVMALYALFREHPRLSTAELEEHFDLNLSGVRLAMLVCRVFFFAHLLGCVRATRHTTTAWPMRGSLAPHRI